MGALVRLREPRLGGGVAVAPDAPCAGWRRAVERHVSNRRLRVRLDLGFAICRSAPRGDHEAGTALEHLLEGVVGGHALRVLVAKGMGAPEYCALHIVEQVAQARRQTVHRNPELLARVAPGNEDL